MTVKIAILSGKGGTGKTFFATNVARTLESSGRGVTYLDCDVEAPNAHLFLKPTHAQEETVTLLSPAEIDTDRCNACGRCVEACYYHALARIHDKILFFMNMCHPCGACTLVCPADAIVEKNREIGRIVHGRRERISLYYGLLKTGEGGMAPRLIQNVKSHAGEKGITILDSPPGTACPVVETVKDADLCVLVTDPTPFGIHDLKLAVELCRELDKEPTVVVNRALYMNDTLKTYCNEAGLQILGEIPDDRRIAECYSVGDLAVDRFPEYRSLFQSLTGALLACARNPRRVAAQRSAGAQKYASVPSSLHDSRIQPEAGHKPKELVIISGKGGTGKTSLAASFCALEKKMAIADCDVDAADLHLILNPVTIEKGNFSGGRKAVIDPVKCTGCGECHRACRFDAVRKEGSLNDAHYTVDSRFCEGCGVCGLVCPAQAIDFNPAVNGTWILSDTRFGPMSHARLGVAEQNSGKLVTHVRTRKDRWAAKTGISHSLIDGSPGTGCPVIASITGADYALIVTEPTVSGVHDLRRILDVVRFFNIRSGVVVNKSDLNPEKTREIQRIAKENGSDDLGTIPYDRQVTEAQVQGLSVVEYRKDGITKTIRSLWQSIRDLCFSRL